MPRRKDGSVGRPIIVDSSGEEGRAWRSQVRDAAIAAYGEFRKVLEGPIAVAFEFHLLRPKGHYGTGRNSNFLRDGAPSHPCGMPDVLKLARAVEDSLTSVVWRDDAQIVSELLLKRYGDTEGVQVQVFQEADIVLQLPDAKQFELLLPP
jgi:crossover junction endodeoxyribonuclease RusA